MACVMVPDSAVPPVPPATTSTAPPPPLELVVLTLIVDVGNQILPVPAALELASKVTLPPDVLIAVATPVVGVKSILPPALLLNVMVTLVSDVAPFVRGLVVVPLDAVMSAPAI